METADRPAGDDVAVIEIGVGGLTFDALAAGPPDGPLVLLLHGFPQSSREWRHQLPALAAAGFRAVAPDQRGYSWRARPECVDAYHLDHLVADALGMAAALGSATFHIVGHDWGGVVAWALAGRHPERLRSLTSVSTPHPLAFLRAIRAPRGDQAARSRYIQFFRLPELPERLLLARKGAGLRMLFERTGFRDRSVIDEHVAFLSERRALKAALNWYRALDVAAVAGVGAITTPTLFVWGGDDMALGREAALGTAAYVRGAYEFVELDGVSHWIPEEAPGALNAELIPFLRGPY